MRECFGYHVKSISDHEHRELMPKEVYDIFMRDFVNITKYVNLEDTAYYTTDDGIEAVSRVTYHGETFEITSYGNGRLDAVSNALCNIIGIDYSLESYTEHDLEGKSSSKAASYVGIKHGNKTYWGTGIDSDIMTSSVKALLSAVNIMIEEIGSEK